MTAGPGRGPVTDVASPYDRRCITCYSLASTAVAAAASVLKISPHARVMDCLQTEEEAADTIHRQRRRRWAQ